MIADRDIREYCLGESSEIEARAAGRGGSREINDFDQTDLLEYFEEKSHHIGASIFEFKQQEEAGEDKSYWDEGGADGEEQKAYQLTMEEAWGIRPTPAPTAERPENARILQWNANTLSQPDSVELLKLTNKKQCHIICIDELGRHWSRPPILHGFNMAHHDARGQQTATYVRKGLAFQALKPELYQYEDFVLSDIIKIRVPEPILVVNLYVRPSIPDKERKEFFNHLFQYLKGKQFIIVGDINDNSRTFGDCNKGQRGVIEDVLLVNSVTIANDGSITYPSSGSALDVAIHSREIGVSWEALEELGSDHLPCISTIQESCIPGTEDQHQFSAPQLNWNELTTKTRGFCQHRIQTPNPSQDIPELLELIKSIPRTRKRVRSPCKWWDQHLAFLLSPVYNFKAL